MTRPEIPIEIMIEITGQCPLRCNYCTNPAARAPHVPLSQISTTLTEAAELKIPAIRFTGGEPLLHPQLRDILNQARQAGLYITVNTSAEQISPAQMRALNSDVNCVLISLQGYNQRSNQSYTKSRTGFSQKLKNIFALKALIPTLRLGTVITPELLKNFAHFASLVKKIAPVSWGLFRPISADANATRSMDRSFYSALILNVLRLRQEGINVQISNALPLCVSGNSKAGQASIAGSQLDDGHLRIVRDAKGFFKPSYFINANLGETIKEAWAHPLLKELDRTDHLPSVCQQCPLLTTCLGGSRAMALRSAGSFLANDPLFIFPSC